jgi:hypothetical protein
VTIIHPISCSFSSLAHSNRWPSLGGMTCAELIFFRIHVLSYIIYYIRRKALVGVSFPPYCTQSESLCADQKELFFGVEMSQRPRLSPFQRVFHRRGEPFLRRVVWILLKKSSQKSCPFGSSYCCMLLNNKKKKRKERKKERSSSNYFLLLQERDASVSRLYHLKNETPPSLSLSCSSQLTKWRFSEKKKNLHFLQLAVLTL